MKSFDYYVADNLDAAVAEYNDGKPALKAGGIDLIDLMKERVVVPDAVLSIGQIKDLSYIREQADGARIGCLTTLADIGALNAFTNERRSALWQVERAVRPAGEMFGDRGSGIGDREEIPNPSPLPVMNDSERLQADYAGMGLTIGPHPMALRRDDMALRGVLRASDLPRVHNGRRVRVAGMVITRQRPGTAKGFVFLTLEDETGISNVIIRPDLFDRERLVVIRQPFLIVEGVLQHQDGVLSVRAERLQPIQGSASVDAHDFY